MPALRQHGELWDLLVPDSGQCQTLYRGHSHCRGTSAMRFDNGGINWDRSFGKLLDQYLPVSSFQACRCRLPPVARAEAAVASEGSLHIHQAVDDITELAVAWKCA